MVSSTVPKFELRCPPVLATLPSKKARSSTASCPSWERGKRRRSAGSSMDCSRGKDWFCIKIWLGIGRAVLRQALEAFCPKNRAM